MLGTSATGQAFAVGTPIKVIDYGELYSTYNWGEAERAVVNAIYGDLAEDVIASSRETGWPAGIANFDVRSTNREKMNGYTLFFLTMLNDYTAILLVPEVENSFMPEDMQPEDDIYFIVTLKGIEAKPTGVAAPISKGFAAQMDEITQDFKNGFANVTNAIIHEDEEGFSFYYGTLVPLDGSDEIYFIEDLMAASTIFHAGFPGNTDPAVAQVAYRELVSKVEALNLSCCPLAKDEELVVGNSRSQTFRPFNPKGNLDVAFQNMVIEIRLEQGETFDNDGQILDFWIPVISIFEQ